MKFIEPAFDPAEASWRTMPGATHDDVGDLPDRLAKQSTELSLRLNEILELYNIQSRQEEALQIAGEEIVRLKQTISGLQEFATRQKEEAIAIKDKVVRLESEKAGLRSQLERTLRKSKALEERMAAAQAAFDAKEANVLSALEQIEDLNSELTTGAAERFKLVAAVHSEKRRHNQQTSSLENKVKKTEAKTEIQETQIKHLEAVRAKLDRRVHVLEALLRSEHELADQRIKRLTDELQRKQPMTSLPTLQDQSS
ncbi:MAG: hypothetical protein WAL36_07345 [Pseudolabrys sp.]